MKTSGRLCVLIESAYVEAERVPEKQPAPAHWLESPIAEIKAMLILQYP
ncbi:hypothetical protein N9O71_02145 [bacterium]|nr:hypothetical protein [bacterium]